MAETADTIMNELTIKDNEWIVKQMLLVPNDPKVPLKNITYRLQENAKLLKPKIDSLYSRNQHLKRDLEKQKIIVDQQKKKIIDQEEEINRLKVDLETRGKTNSDQESDINKLQEVIRVLEEERASELDLIESSILNSSGSITSSEKQY